MSIQPICSFCLKPIEGTPFIVDDQDSETSAYYHRECPKRVMSPDELSATNQGVYVHITARDHHAGNGGDK